VPVFGNQRTPEVRSPATEREPEVPARPSPDDSDPVPVAEESVPEANSGPSELQQERRTDLYGRRKRN
jgi:hypothetical protein